MAIRSIALRLVLGAGIWIAAALLAGGIALSALFRDYVQESFDARLTVLLESLIAVVEVGTDGTLSLSRGVGEPRFELPFSGWYWQVAEAGKPVLRSRSLWDEALSTSAAPAATAAIASETAGPDGQPLRILERDIALPGAAGRYRFAIAGDRGEIDAAVARFNRTLGWSLGLLGAGLLLALLIQIRYGLEPLRRMRQAVAAVRTGRASRLEGGFPVEIAPVADELNTLVEHNAAVLERARTQVSNLAHALKTPLSVLANDAAAGSGPLADSIGRQVGLMRRQVDHYLARARTAAAARVLGVRTEVAPVVEDLRRTLARIHVDRQIAIETDIPAGLAIRGERQDLEEMVGNLGDNGCKWAKRRVAIAARREGGRVLLTVDDDGPGLPEAQRASAFDRGKRLDESVPGTGHGLAIVREIAELHDGAIALEASPLGGLRALLTLPAADTI